MSRVVVSINDDNLGRRSRMNNWESLVLVSLVLSLLSHSLQDKDDGNDDGPVSRKGMKEGSSASSSSSSQRGRQVSYAFILSVSSSIASLVSWRTSSDTRRCSSRPYDASFVFWCFVWKWLWFWRTVLPLEDDVAFPVAQQEEEENSRRKGRKEKSSLCIISITMLNLWREVYRSEQEVGEEDNSGSKNIIITPFNPSNESLHPCHFLINPSVKAVLIHHYIQSRDTITLKRTLYGLTNISF